MKVIGEEKLKGVMVDYLTRKVVKSGGSTANLLPASLQQRVMAPVSPTKNSRYEEVSS